MKKKVFLGIFLILILITNISFASYSTVTMSVVEEPVCTIELGSNSSFEKKLISKDLKNKEVTIQLKVTNGEEAEKPTGEIMLVIDNSDSMNSKVEGKTRKDLVFNSANTLVSNLLKDNDKLKIGIVRFSTNLNVDKEGTIEDASVVSELSNNSLSLTNAISGIEANGPRTDLQSGLLLASQQFSSEKNNKYIIVLTDGVPNVAIDYDKKYYSDDVINKTKQQLLDIDQKGIDIITMLTGIENDSEKPMSDFPKTYGQIISEIFGSTTKPTAGSFNYITDDKIEETITNTIYNSLMPIKKSLKDIKVVDYFPEEIIKNFDFSYVSEYKNISAKVDTTNNSITWNIPELASGESLAVEYKLKLKESFDSKIVDKILNTNQKVDITYKDIDEKEQAKTSNISPKLKLTEPPIELPKAGTPILIGLSILACGLLVFSLTNLTIINKKTK